MIVRRYNSKSEFNSHHDDIIEEIFPQWFVRRKNVLTCNIYLNDRDDMRVVIYILHHVILHLNQT
ncbi:MAG: hypothetical protein CM15mV9_1840 [uncultured marine virus]|nr:MAG: hypothetical protein CM15mV9_1840 [uncultured marine virus]